MYQMASVMRTLEIFDMDDTWGVVGGKKDSLTMVLV
jgi:hypothetical protein